MNSKKPKLMGIDYGSKKVGIASTDESGEFALPRAVWPNDQDLVARVIKYKDEEGIDKIVLGESNNLSGEPNPIQEEINRFKEQLEERGVEVVLHPEILTTMEARRLQGNNEMNDASAAAIILKSFIDKMYN